MRLWFAWLRSRVWVAWVGPTWLCTALAATDPDVDHFNYGLGTQTFAGLYQFTDETLLVETARAITNLGSNTLKFYLGPEFPRQYRIPLPRSIQSLAALVNEEPSCRAVLDLPFRYYIMWAYTFDNGWWHDGWSSQERDREYRQIYDLTRHLLARYNGTGKSFWLGHWEGDWHLLNGFDATIEPPDTAIQGMIDWLNTRQQAVDDAKRDTAHERVEVFHYTEVNRVRDAMSGRRRVANRVLPRVANLDYVSWSSYDAQDLAPQEVRNTLTYLETMLPTNKAPVIPDKRVFVGEYGWGHLALNSQEPRARPYLRTLLDWGCPFALYWQIYNNEAGRNWCLVNTNREATPVYWLHERLLNRAKLFVAETKQNTSRLPTQREYRTWAIRQLTTVQAPFQDFEVMNLAITNVGTRIATVSGTVYQGRYGAAPSQVMVCYGQTDATTNLAQWDHRLALGHHTRYGLVTWSTNLTGLQPSATYLFRFCVTNRAGLFWAPNSTVWTTTNAVAPPGAQLKFHPSAGGWVLSWSSEPAHVYALEFCANLSAPWLPLKEWLVATPPLNQYAATDAELQAGFYRVVTWW